MQSTFVDSIFDDDSLEAAADERFGLDQSAPRLFDVLFFVCVSGVAYFVIWYLSTVNVRAAGVCYAMFFGIVSVMRFHWALALTMGLVCFQQDLGGLPIKMAIAEINLALLVPALLIRKGALPIAQRLIIPAVAYLAFCFLVTIGEMDSAAIKSLLQMVLYLVLAVGVFSRARCTPSEIYWCLDVMVVVITLYALSGLLTGFSIFNTHKNGWGASLSLGLIVAFELWQTCEIKSRKNWLSVAVAILTMGLVLTVSRGGWLAAMSGIAVLLTLRRDWNVLGRLALVVIPMALIAWFLMPEETQQYSLGFERSRGNIAARFINVATAKRLWLESPLFGAGVGLRKEYDATNVAMLVLAETGVIGLILFSNIHIQLGKFIWTSHTWLPQKSIAFSCVALAGALVAARLAHGMVDHYWSRGAILAAWAAVGLAISATEDDLG